jgi:hypothetical protein
MFRIVIVISFYMLCYRCPDFAVDSVLVTEINSHPLTHMRSEQRNFILPSSQRKFANTKPLDKPRKSVTDEEEISGVSSNLIVGSLIKVCRPFGTQVAAKQSNGHFTQVSTRLFV